MLLQSIPGAQVDGKTLLLKHKRIQNQRLQLFGKVPIILIPLLFNTFFIASSKFHNEGIIQCENNSPLVPFSGK